METIKPSDAASPDLLIFWPGKNRAKARRLRDFSNIEDRKKLRIEQGDKSAVLISCLRGYR
jgi:hypothetical protein